MTGNQQRVYEYLTANPLVSSRVAARELGFGKDIILTVRHMMEDEFNPIKELQERIAKKLVNKVRFMGDAIITADHHNPCADLRIVQQIILAAKDYKIKRLLDIGDFFNFDALSSYARKICGDKKLPDISDELEMGSGILKRYSEVFDEIVLIEGNHEARFAKLVSNQLGYDTIVKALALPKVKLVDANYIYLDDIRLTHPRSYSQIKMAIAKRLTMKFMEPCFQAHGHFATWGFADNGLPCGDIPCVCDPDRITYLQGGDTTHPFWNQGFIIYKDGELYPRAKRFGLKI